MGLVFLTKTWTAILTFLTTMCLGGMFLLATGSPKGFTEADRTAVEAVAEAGLAALSADIESSPASLGPSLLNDSRLRMALEESLRDVPNPASPDLQTALSAVAGDTLLDSHNKMSVALIDKDGTIIARTGMSDQHFDELVEIPAFKKAQSAEQDSRPFSVTLNGHLHAVKVSAPEISTAQRRLVAINPVELGAGSFFRKVIHASPAGIVREGNVVGETIGGAQAKDLAAAVAARDLPKNTVTPAFEVGESTSQRLAAMGRLPGPAGETTVFVVLSKNALGSTDTDLAAAVKAAKATGAVSRLPWPVLAALLVLGLMVSLYLPHLESARPLSRLKNEFLGLATGAQHQIFHETYGGKIGEMAQAAAAAIESLRHAMRDETPMGTDEDEPADPSSASMRSPSAASSQDHSPSAPSNAGTKEPARERSGAHASHKAHHRSPAAIDLPTVEHEGTIEHHSHSVSDGSSDTPPPSKRRAEQSPSTPRLPSRPAPSGPTSTKLVDGKKDSPALTLTDEADNAVSPRKASLVSRSAMPTADVSPREVYYQSIFDQFVATKKECGENAENLTYDRFAKKLRKNTENLMRKPGVAEVKFSVYVKDGKAALKAKIVKK